MLTPPTRGKHLSSGRLENLRPGSGRGRSRHSSVSQTARACSLARHNAWRQGCQCRKRATTLALRSGTGTTADRCPAVAVHARGGGTPGCSDGAGRGTRADAPASTSASAHALGSPHPAARQPLLSPPASSGPLSNLKSGCRNMLLRHADESDESEHRAGPAAAPQQTPSTSSALGRAGRRRRRRRRRRASPGSSITSRARPAVERQPSAREHGLAARLARSIHWQHRGQFSRAQQAQPGRTAQAGREPGRPAATRMPGGNACPRVAALLRSVLACRRPGSVPCCAKSGGVTGTVTRSKLKL